MKKGRISLKLSPMLFCSIIYLWNEVVVVVGLNCERKLAERFCIAQGKCDETKYEIGKY